MDAALRGRPRRGDSEGGLLCTEPPSVVATVATVAAGTLGTAAAAVVVVEFTDALSLRAKEFLFGSQENRSAAEGPWEEVTRRV